VRKKFISKPLPEAVVRKVVCYLTFMILTEPDSNLNKNY
jgi:hypothetical protein